MFQQNRERLEQVSLQKVPRVWFRIGSYPFRVIGLSVFLALIYASGVHKLTNESRSEKLWVPGDTRAQDDRILWTITTEATRGLEAWF